MKTFLSFFRKILFFGVVLPLFCGLLIFIIINLSTKPYIWSDIKTLPKAEVIVILGAGILRDGGLSPILEDRTGAALLLYQSEKATKILITGDNSTLSHNEVIPVKDYLVAKGVPAPNIYLDYAGFDTYSSMYRARDIFEAKDIIVVTQAFHLPRAIYIARKLGLTAYGFEADNMQNYFSKAAKIFGSRDSFECSIKNVIKNLF